MLLTLPQIEGKIREFTNIIYTPEEFIPTFGSSKQTGLAHIEIGSSHYNLIVCEDGKELSREAFYDADKLVLQVLEDISFSMACDRVFQDTNFVSFKERFLKVQGNIMAKIKFHNERTSKQDQVGTEDSSMLAAERRNILLKSQQNKTTSESKLSS